MHSCLFGPCKLEWMRIDCMGRLIKLSGVYAVCHPLQCTTPCSVRLPNLIPSLLSPSWAFNLQIYHNWPDTTWKENSEIGLFSMCPLFWSSLPPPLEWSLWMDLEWRALQTLLVSLRLWIMTPLFVWTLIWKQRLNWLFLWLSVLKSSFSYGTIENREMEPFQSSFGLNYRWRDRALLGSAAYLI